MYINYGDRNFFEYGLLIDTEHSDSVFDMLICQPYCDEEDLYIFGQCQIDIEDSWLEWDKILDFAGMKEDDNISNIDKAIAALEFYGPEEFSIDSFSGYSYDWRHMTREQIKEELKYYMIAYDNLIIE